MCPNEDQPVNPATPTGEGAGADVPPPAAEPVATEGDDKDARLWATIAHLAAFAGFIGVPFGNILGPLIVWLVKRNDLPFVDDQGREALNFQISLTIYGTIAAVLCFVLIGFFLLAAIYLGGIILVIIAAVKANKGEYYRYPLTIRLLK